MEKLTLEQIAPYFTDCLYVQVKTVDGTEILPITAIQRKDGCDIIQISNTDYYPNEDDNEFTIAPILRKCDLTKPIMVNGKEEVPLIELAKIVWPNLLKDDWFIDGRYDEVSSNHYDRPSIRYNDGVFEITEDANDDRRTTTPIHTNQLQLFEYMYSRMFDLKGLIEKGLAVDADTLEINPYNN